MEKNVFVVGVLAGSLPVFVNLIVSRDMETLSGLGAAGVISYFVRVALLVSAGVVFSWLHEGIATNRLAHFNASTGIPSILTAALAAGASATALGAGTQAADGVATLLPPTPVFAAQQSERRDESPAPLHEFTLPEATLSQQFLFGFLGRYPDLPEYFIEINETTSMYDAIEKMKLLKAEHDEADIRVFKPSLGIDEYVVTYGGQVTLSEALDLLDQAWARGILDADLNDVSSASAASRRKKTVAKR